MLATTLRIYLAGPMTGIPQFNFPAFDAAANALRKEGYTILSPHELDSVEVQAAAWASPDGKLDGGMVAGETWGQILGRDVETIADRVDAIAFLPDWHKSRGARLEAFVGLLCGKKFFDYAAGMQERDANWVKERIL